MSELEPQDSTQETAAEQPAPQVEAVAAEAAEVAEAPKPEAQPARPKPQEKGPGRGAGKPPERAGEKKDRPAGARPERGDRPDRRPPGDKGTGDRGERRGPRDERRGGDRPRPPEMAAEIDLDRLASDSLYLDNQAHAVVARMRDMDSGTRSQLRRLFSAVRRACRAAESERQHHFVMLRARLAYTIARHQLRSLDPLERLLLQVTRKNDPRGYERFRDLFEAIVAYNE
jgi:CRISPR type III-A-associated protein Csm2